MQNMDRKNVIIKTTNDCNLRCKYCYNSQSWNKKENLPEDRYYCNDWEKQPEFHQPQDVCRLGNDYYGGDLKGIEEKLDYLKELGVTCIYLNPIFEAHSNHRYNTADYSKIDPCLGDEKDLESLIKKAEKVGISIILDGVFSHTGDDSIYFNKKGRYNSLGAYQSKQSPFYKWFNFNSSDYFNTKSCRKNCKKKLKR